MAQLPPPPEWSPLDNRILAHWKQFRPRMTRELTRQGQLEQAVYEAVSRALAQEQALVAQGLERDQAWELVQQDLFLPEETPPADQA